MILVSLGFFRVGIVECIIGRWKRDLVIKYLLGFLLCFDFVFSSLNNIEIRMIWFLRFRSIGEVGEIYRCKKVMIKSIRYINKVVGELLIEYWWRFFGEGFVGIGRVRSVRLVEMGKAVLGTVVGEGGRSVVIWWVWYSYIYVKVLSI